MPRYSSSFVGCAAKLLPLVALLAATVPQVSAHGYVGSISPDGKTINGPKPADEGGATDASSAIRLAFSEQPVILNESADTSMKSPQMACKETTNMPAGTVASVTAGSSMPIQWLNGGGTPQWAHNVGPILTYMAACGDDSCSDDPTTLDFFKIDEAGQVEGSTSVWAQLQIQEGHPYNVTIPSALANGAYLMRHEIINLAPGPGQSESYPSCFQLTVTGGSGSGSPSSFVSSLGSSATVKFPGGYAASDAGLNFDAYAGKTYTFPGPAIPAALSGSGGNSTTPADPPASSSVLPSTTASTKVATTTKAASVKTTSAPAVTTTSAPSGGKNRVFVTTITEVWTMTMTLGDDDTSSTPVTSSAPAATTTSSPEDPEDDCVEEEEETITSSAPATTSTLSVARRHASARMRRSEGWKFGAASYDS